MHRFFTTEIQGNRAFIRGDDVKHIARVLRLRTGDVIRICDGKGNECESSIVSVGNDVVVSETGEWFRSVTEPATSVTLFQCIPKSGKMETIIQKCVELGIDAFVPVQSERCVVILKPPYDSRIDRWQRVSEEAAKQSRRGRIPIVHAPCNMEDLEFGSFDAVFAAYENERTTTFKQALKQCVSCRNIAILIGPEGGFSDHEIELLKEKGAISVSLGPRILRTETAGMSMVAQIMYEVEL